MAARFIRNIFSLERANVFSPCVITTMKKPTNLNECFHELTKRTTPKSRDEFMRGPEDSVYGLHFTTGMGIRNGWGLWHGSKLAKYFNRLGIYHADDMSGIILTSYHRHLNKKPVEMKKQVKFYRNFWVNQGVDPKTFENKIVK